MQTIGAATTTKRRAASINSRMALLNTLALASILPCFAQAPSGKHKVSVKFDYDFTLNHACSVTVKAKCTLQFNVYDISAGKPFKLFSIPAPPTASGPLQGISGESQPLLFESGKHLLAVTAQMASGEESNPNACTLWVQVP